jgi:hypothetical protein
VAEKKTNPFKLRDFRGVNPEHVATLAGCGIRTAPQFLACAATPQQRAALSTETGIPEEALRELACLSDLARLPGVKGIRARLYLDAGIEGVAAMSAWEPEPLRLMVIEYALRAGFDGIPPLPKEVSSTIENAKKLPKILEL